MYTNFQNIALMPGAKETLETAGAVMFRMFGLNASRLPRRIRLKTFHGLQGYTGSQRGKYVQHL